MEEMCHNFTEEPKCKKCVTFLRKDLNDVHSLNQS